MTCEFLATTMARLSEAVDCGRWRHDRAMGFAARPELRARTSWPRRLTIGGKRYELIGAKVMAGNPYTPVRYSGADLRALVATHGREQLIAVRYKGPGWLRAALYTVQDVLDGAAPDAPVIVARGRCAAETEKFYTTVIMPSLMFDDETRSRPDSLCMAAG